MSQSTVTFQYRVSPAASFVGVADKTLQEASPALVAAGSADLNVDHDYPTGSGKSADVLIKFDVSTIPSNATVTSAKLVLNVTNRSTGSVSLFEMKRPWWVAAASWSAAASGTPWGAAGARGAADRSSTAFATLTPTSTGELTLSFDAKGLATVQAWVASPSLNHGFCIDSVNNADGFHFDASEATVAAHRPSLTVTYSVAASGSGSTPSGGFVHPGINVDLARLNFVKAKLAAGAQPWTDQLSRAERASFIQAAWVNHAVATMECGTSTDVGCSAASNDALTAYTLALLWYHTGNRAYAERAITILDAWAKTLKTIKFVQGSILTNGSPLRAAWLSEVWPKTAELLRYSNSGWSEEDAKRFGAFLHDVVLPWTKNGWFGGTSNWNTSMADGTMAIGVYNDDRATFEQGLALFRAAVPRVLYQTSDGASPLGSPDFTNANGTWKAGDLLTAWHGAEFGQARDNGTVAEMCRDLGHTQMTLSSVAQAAETARIQGVDLWTEYEKRIVDSYELIAKWENAWAPTSANRAATVSTPSWVCGGKMIVEFLPTWEIAYNHYATAKAVPMPQTLATIEKMRPQASYTFLQMQWETLTHAGTGDR